MVAWVREWGGGRGRGKEEGGGRGTWPKGGEEEEDDNLEVTVVARQSNDG